MFIILLTLTSFARETRETTNQTSLLVVIKVLPNHS